MERLLRLQKSTRLLRSLEGSAILRQNSVPPSSALIVRTPIRNASTTNKSKPIVLEQPDKFRPPSHGSRLVKGRGRGSTFHGAYNQGSTASEQEAQRKRSYPHMFPDQGTFMHWFLTSRAWHLVVTLGVLFFLAGVTMVQTFVHTSPFGYLLPSLTSLPFHPIRFFTELLYVVKLHQDYITDQTEFARARNTLDTQKRRIYRRAHGMEDLDRDEDQGVDVRGIVPWDDGLTKREREGGGIGANRIKMASAIQVGESDKIKAEATGARLESRKSEQDMRIEMFIQRRQAELGLTAEDDPVVARCTAARDVSKIARDALGPIVPVAVQQERQHLGLTWQEQRQQPDEQPQQAEAQPQPQAQPQRKRKLWLGIW